MENVTLIELLLAAAIPMVVGFLWYGPLFGKPWMSLVGIDPNKMADMKKDMGRTYGLMFVASVVTAFVLAQFVAYADALTVGEGTMVGFWAWLGFVATSMFSNVLFLKKPMQLYKIDAGYHLVSLALMGAFLAFWQ